MTNCNHRAAEAQKTLNLSSLVQFISRKRFENESRMTREQLGSNSVMTRERLGSNSVMTRERLGSVVSRFSLASLICLCMLTVGVGNAWGADAQLYFEGWESHHRTSGSNNYGSTSKTYGDFSFVYADAVSSGSPLTGSYHAILRNASTSNYTCSLTSTALLSSSYEIHTIKWNCKGNTAQNLKVYYSTNGSTWTEGYDNSLPSSKTERSITSLSITGPIYLKFEVSNNNTTNSNRDANIDDITIEGVEVTSCEKIGAPTVTATPGDRQISLSWPNQAEASSYAVTCPGGTVGTITGTTTKSCTITGLTNGTSYTWTVTPVGDGTTHCASGNTAASASATPNVFRTITYYDKDGQHTTSLADGTNIATALTALYGGDDPVSCDAVNYGYFVGWRAGAISGTTTSPSLLTTETVNSSSPSNNYYAVWSDTDPEASGGWTKASSIAAGDVVILVNEGASKELTAVGTSATGYGTATDYSSIPNGTYPLTVEVGNGGTGFSFKNGNNYLCYNSDATSSSNYLWTITDKTNYSSWTVSISEDDATITNIGNTTRKLRYNSGSPRFSCYTTDQTAVQIYKQTSSGTPNYITTCEACTYKLTLTQEATTNGSFTMHNGSASGTTISSGSSIDNCSSDAVIVVVAEPTSGYRVASVSATNKKSDIVDNGDNTFTITYAADANTSSTISVSFEAIPRYTITLNTGTGSVSGGGWSGSAGTYTQQQASAGASITLPTASPSSTCAKLDWEFAGWKEGSAQTETTSAPTLVDAGTSVTPESNVTYYAVYKMTEGGGGDAETLFSWAGGASSGLTGTTGVSAYGLGSDYSAGNSPYLIKLDDTGDYIIITTSAAIGSVAIGVKMIGGAYTSTITVQESTAADGTFTDVQALSISGAQNDVLNLSTTNSFASTSRAVKLLFTKGSNVGVGPITITGVPGITTWTSSPACEGTATVTYNANGASSGTAPTDSNSPYDLGASVTVLGNTGNLTKTGLNFGGWNTAADGSGTTYQPGATFTIKSNVTLYAKWVTLHTVTLIDNGHSTNISVADGETYSLPDEYLSKCEDATFLGWATGTYTDHETGTDDEPSYDAPGTEKVIAANTTFVAVYGTVEASNSYDILSDKTNFVSGKDYLIAAYKSSTDYAVQASITNAEVSSSSKSLSSTNNTITDASLVWTITITDAVNSRITLYNAYTGKYLGFDPSTNELVLSNAPIQVKYVITDGSSGYSDHWDFYSATDDSYIFSINSSNKYESSTSMDYNIYLYNRKYAVSNFTSKPQCCHEPAEALTLTAGGSSIVNSGTVVLTLTGGNGTTVTWTCKDEADNNCDSYLSETSGTGAKVNLPTNAATKVYTITATQADDETDEDNVICGASVSTSITVKTQFAITLKTKDNDEANVYDTYTVTDGESYTLPDISDDYNCEDNYSFAGWSTNESATSVEKTAGSTVTATAAATWWAVWSHDEGGAETVTKYEKVTVAGELVADATFVLAYNAYAMSTSVSSGYAGKVSVTLADDGSYVAFPSTTTSVQILTLKGSTGAWKLYDADNEEWLVMNSTGNISWTDTEGDATEFAITITDGKAAIQTDDYYLQYNATSPRFKGYKSTSNQNNATLYKNKGNTVSIASDVSATYFVNNENCTSGSIIRAESGKWVTSANGKKVKLSIPVVAKGFAAPTELSVTSNNGNFTVSLASTDVPATPSQLETTLTVEYTPVAAETTENATITLRAGETTKNIIVNGRSLPDEFAIISKKNGLWYALPADMNAGQSQYAGVQVTPDDPTTPNILPVSPSTVIYSLQAVAPSRYEAAGNCVRLPGNGNKCLWSNATTTNTTIQNYAVLGNTNGSNYEWQLTTTDGVNYTITNPAHPDYASGRMLAMGGTGGTQFGMYKTAATFCIVPVGCSSLPTEVSVSPKRTQATFSWTSNAGSTRIDVWTNEGMTEGNINTTVSSSPAVLPGLAENTQYWYKLTPDGSDDCAYTGTFSTTGPTIDVAEWLQNGVNVMIDVAGNPRIVVQGEEEHGVGAASATTLFFAKYFEGSGSMKLLSIFNGTANNISLADYTIKELHAGSSASTYGSNKEYDLSSLGSIAAGQEIILYTRPSESWLTTCSNTYFGAVSSKNTASDNPRWIECDGSTFAKLEFNGNDALILYNGSDEVDIIGGMSTPGSDDNCRYEDSWTGTALNMDYQKKPGDSEFAEFFNKSSLDFSSYTTADSITFLEKCGINLSDEEIDVTTARIILFRNNTVTEGVTTNTGADFASFTKEQWSGRSVCQTSTMYEAAGYTSDGEATCSSYQFLGDFDYNKYYTTFTDIGDPTYLNSLTHNTDGTYTINIDNMRQYACLNLNFQITDHDNENLVLAEQKVQVPIVVVDSRNSNDTLFNNVVKDDDDAPVVDASIERCKTCNVVVRPGGTLTKALDDTEHDVAELFNLKIYPGGKLVIPEGDYNYKLNTLAMRRDGEDIPLADIQGGLTIGQSKGVYLDLRIDHSDWHYVALPYDCRLSDVTFSDGTVAVLNTDYFVAAYDGEYRAANKKTKWTDIMDDDYVLKKGIGHIIALSGSGSDKRELRFPMANDVISEEKASSKTVSGVYGYGADKTDEELRPNHKGWNMVGNPYFKYFSPADFTTPLATGELVHSTVVPWDGTWITKEGTGSLRYVVRPIDNGWSGYEQVLIGGTKMEPFTAYFVQIGITGEQTPETEQSVIFNKSKLSMNASARRRVKAEETENMYPVWYGIELIAPNAEKDQTALLISDEFTDGYDMMNDLAKQRGDYYTYYNKPVLASRNNEGEMVFNALPDASAATVGVPLNFYAAQAGTHTIATDFRYDLEEVKSAMLHDATNNIYTDLLTQNYEFTASKGNNTDRFTLYVRVERKKAPNPETDMDNILDGKLSLITIGKTLVLSGLTGAADVYVYDMSGKLLSRDQAGNGIWRTTVPATGVYFVRVNSANGQQTLRAIVK